jgi:hypothetical protein
MSSFTMAQLDEMAKEVSQKGGSVEGKIVKYAGQMLGLQNVIEAHRSLDCVIQSAESLLMMAVIGKMTINFTAQRIDNEFGHSVDNCEPWCYQCKCSTH